VLTIDCIAVIFTFAQVAVEKMDYIGSPRTVRLYGKEMSCAESFSIYFWHALGLFIHIPYVLMRCDSVILVP